MRGGIIAFVAAIIVLQLQATLPPLVHVLSVGLALALASVLRTRLRPFLLIACASALGLAYGTWRAELRLADRLPPELERQTLVVTGIVSDLPERTASGIRLRFRVESAPSGVPELLQLSDYQSKTDWQPGQRWRLTVRLKRPHGEANPGGFDNEGFLLGEGIGATGNLTSGGREQLADFVPSLRNAIDRIRMQIARRIRAALPAAPYAEIIVALVVGDQSGISDAQWQLFRNTGSMHLVAISGLHVTMLAGVASGLFGRVWRRFPRLTDRLPSRKAALFAGLIAALLYTLLAGSRLPTQRSAFMLGAAVIGILSGRHLAATTIWLLSLGLCVPIDPWAVLSSGFWLSYLTVGALIWALAGDLTRPNGWRTKLRAWWQTQWAATLATAPPLLVLFQQLPLASPLAFATSVPLVCGLVTPLALLGVIDPTGWLLHAAHAVLSLAIHLLQPFSRPNWQWSQIAPPLWTLLPAALAVGTLLLPRGAPAKWAALVLMLPIALPLSDRPPAAAYRVITYDVGQGLAVLVQTAQHNLLFDAGPTAGGSNPLPAALRSAGVAKLDMLLISNHDRGSVTGVPDILASFPVSTLRGLRPPLTAPDAPSYSDRPLTPCEAGQSWAWDGVLFSVLAPNAAPEPGKTLTLRDCVLKIDSPAGRILLPANIERAEQEHLVDRLGPQLRAEVLLMPHHGSKGGWSPDFLTAVSPSWAIAAAGYMNPYQHPRADVVAAYREAGSKVYETAREGAILFRAEGHTGCLRTWRSVDRHYWDQAPSPPSADIDACPWPNANGP
ncbi:MAG: DNA internalization-related competence protein ComEC/Rec2 [Burkholderiales bacterium]|nr:DNA internalization-related competence protein ComEC/Rec2 [Burkholderiales bacterium]